MEEEDATLHLDKEDVCALVKEEANEIRSRKVANALDTKVKPPGSAGSGGLMK